MNDMTESRSLAERAYRRLRGEILHGDLMPGDRLRAGDLQGRFDLGLTPIREALARLSSEGLVDAEVHRGSRVTPASREKLADLMATRRAIERLCLAGAMQHGAAAWEAEIVAALHLLSRTLLPQSEQDRAAASLWEAQHRRFHHALVAACGSEWLLRIWNTLADHSERYRKMRLLRYRDAGAGVRDIGAEHAALAAAVLQRDVARATELMDDHLRATEEAVAHFLDGAALRRNPAASAGKGSRERA